MEEPTIACPSCSREFQIPQKSARPDDLEFLPIPRVLSCLHTVCQSCLQEMTERNTYENERAACPICRREVVVEDVNHLPLDVSILKNLLSTSQADVLSFCSRCYDEVPSFSWCQTCSTALCEFHHQDHKLSVDTSKHSLQTFKEISHKHLHIVPRLPAIPCPEIDKQECTAYCHDCNRVCSIHAILQNHSDHTTEDCLHGYNTMRARVQTSLDRSKGTGKELKVALRGVTNRMRELDRECERATREIEEEFDGLRKLLNERESALIDRLGVVSERKRSMLSTQLGNFSEYIDECYLTSDIAESLLRVTDDMRGTSQDAAYLVGLTNTVESKVDGILEKLRGVNMNPDTDADIAVSFNLSELGAVQLNVPILGCIQTREDSDNMGRDDGVVQDVGPLHSKHKSLHKQRVVQTHAPTITFTIKAEPNQNGNIVDNSSDRNSGSSSSTSINKSAHNQSLVIEARSTDSFVEDGKASNNRNHGLGVLLGQVILTTEMDKKLAVRHEIRSFFESVVIKNIPIMKITKEFLPNSTNYSPYKSPERGGKTEGASTSTHERGRIDGRDRSVERGDLKNDRSQGRSPIPDSMTLDFQRLSSIDDNDQQQRGESKTKKTADRSRDKNERYRDHDIKEKNDRKVNTFLGHANDKVNVHGQRGRHKRESNY